MRNLGIVMLAWCAGLGLCGCDEQQSGGGQTAKTGVRETTATINVGADGLTVEQRNVRKRLEADNKPGSIKHLYVISAYSGQVIIYSTVDGKVTSGGKRLTAGSRAPAWGYQTSAQWYSPEVVQDDGTFGSSAEYLFWFDSKGNYHQHYVSGGQIVHVSDQPLSVKSVIINNETGTTP